MKTILNLNHFKAKEYFLKEESYINIDLPHYYIFSELIKKISKEIEYKQLTDFYNSTIGRNGKPKSTKPYDYENVNYKFLNNKDGKYSWRPFQLIHPAIYVSLVHKITEKENWEFITNRFLEFSNNPQINCYSIPIHPKSKHNDKAETIRNWWQQIEQKSIELALKYEYILHTDISDCYGSIYTHSIAWAIHTKETAKDEKKNKKLIGNIIDQHLKDMSHGQTNGIPQGSSLMDFIAEIVLGYVDLELSNRIKVNNVSDYEIIRYRDDFRIFTNNPQDAELIMKKITEILIDLGMRLNTQKTIVSNNVIEDSLKTDKLYWLLNKKRYKNLQDQLLIIHNLSKEYPNSGSLYKELDKYYKKIKRFKRKHQNIKVLISILIDIAYNNPRTYPIVAAILSKFLSSLVSNKDKNEILDTIEERFNKIPNTGYLQIWLQRIVIKIDRERDFNEILCRKVNDQTIEIWNSDWLEDNLKNMINDHQIIDEGIIEQSNETIEPKEVEIFKSTSGYSYD